ncbi:uncharacterized protein ACLA_048110 [Aspergillus clavatus NRRL 1]|uniref:Cep57 centrosome microtubule-binding domain-containing protein n=1 Tax=Aspergillus clavatus (strain ATCC 1007 / CBS 513.65 / DSM 816 / NCTC 3887 / NRRL 1 / QM 1276 / 107) TaxID=344612 RepID=A1CHI7_ASPCL|nr:uncharacterized protein ACLA_048110 [Aspergillus clavatus NRRL 1]EAW10342.1 conserved hypothetical protein [Aspergillus clavatus NRRL 1]
MSRENTRRSEATTNSFASFGSDFDPEHEALASTKHFENSPKLPEMKGSARKQLNDDDDDEPEYAIDTSALERAFPEFSPVGTSEDDTDESISIEAGRGIPKTTRRLDDSRNSMMSIENSVRSSSPAVRLDYPTSYTPQKSAMRGTSRRAVSENLRKDAQLRQASLAHKENRDPLSSKVARKDQRRTLSDMHAKVRDSYDGSFLGDERPQPIATSTRATRFGNVNLSHQIADAVERASQEAYAKEMRRGKMPSNLRNVSGTGAGDTGTMQSFLLPDLPNLSELVSGVYEDGTPVYSRQGRARATRFVSPPHDGAEVSMTREHIPLDTIPIPEDEKALFVSLRLLQDKVSELERAKSEADRKIDEMRQENAALKAGRSRQKDKHGRSRVYESEDDDYRRNRQLAGDHQELEAANLVLQNQLDIAERKVQVNEAALKKLNRERDMAVSQLGIAYLESRDLKSENESLRQENVELKSQLAKFVSHASKSREDTAQSEPLSETDASLDDSQLDTQQSENRSRVTKDLTTKSARSKSRTARAEESRTKISKQVDKEISRLEKERAEDALFSIDLPRARSSTSKSGRSQKQAVATSSKAKKQPNTGKQRVKRVIVEEVTVTEPLESTAEDASCQTRKTSNTEQDLTLLSLVDENEIAQLRKTLEEERLARKRRQSVSTRIQTVDETANSTRQSLSKSAAPRKSSLKESKAPIVGPASALGDLTATSQVSMAEADSNLSVPIERQRRHSDYSVTTTSQRRRRRSTNDMTSAFILPDITLHHANLVAEDPSRLPQAAQKALDGATQHDGKNCTVCKRCIPIDSHCDHTHEVVKVPKPVPVSERMPEPSVYNEEPTLRPAQSPGVALATVLKALEDELSHLRMQLVVYQGAYNKLDASLSKRQRKSLAAKVEKILKDIDLKADQIYALYDVLEGQKQDGHEMTEAEMEVTLQSIGMDTAATRAGDVTATTDKSSNRHNDTDLEDEEELPWEGIESTMDMTGSHRN